MKNVASETTFLYGYTIEKAEYSSGWDVRNSRGEHCGYTYTKGEACDHVRELEAIEYNVLKPDLIRLLTDYRNKLEVDDFDPGAVGKMKDAAAILKILQGGM